MNNLRDHSWSAKGEEERLCDFRLEGEYTHISIFYFYFYFF
jgi:hypothetical protein